METATSLTTAEMKALYARALEQAALGDLQFTLRIAESRLRDFEHSDTTLALIRQMRQREAALTGVKGTKAMQTESLRLISAYRASIAGYASSLKHLTITCYRKDGSRKWVGHRTVLPQRRTPLSAAQVETLLGPVTVPDRPAPARRPASRPAAVAAPVPAQIGVQCPRCKAGTLQGLTCPACGSTYKLHRLVPAGFCRCGAPARPDGQRCVKGHRVPQAA